MTDRPDQPPYPPVRRFMPTPDGHRWECVAHQAYKEDGRELFADISRQTLFSRPDLAGEMRYFEVQPGGYSTLERHQHVHAVLVLRGSGSALVGDEILTLAEHDLVTVPPMIWHQFRAAANAPLGFLCMVDAIRDKPQVPATEELAALRSNPAIARFLDQG